jgi:hypothetical protein
MNRARDILEIARVMIGRHGAQPADVMEQRVQAHRDAGEHEVARFWASVGNAVRALRETC